MVCTLDPCSLRAVQSFRNTEPIGEPVTQEDVIALMDRVASDSALRERLQEVTSAEAIVEIAASMGFGIGPSSGSDMLTDAELDGIGTSATDRTCYGTTDCCQTKRTCFGTTDCCR
jgi:hypothetical protein